MGNKTLEWKVAKELQVGYRRWQKGGPQGGRLDESGRVVGGERAPSRSSSGKSDATNLISGDGGNLRR